MKKKTLPVQKYAAEFVATFSLAFAVSVSLITEFAVATPIVAALVLGLFVYTIGGVSGAHLNPAITIALATLRKISPTDAFLYICAQCIGAVLALQICLALYGNQPGADMIGGTGIGIAEAMGTFFLAFGVCFAVHRGNENNSGLVVGGSLLLGILVASGTSNAVVNPAVSLAVGGLNNISLTYLIAPVIGAVLGMWMYVYLIGEEK